MESATGNHENDDPMNAVLDNDLVGVQPAEKREMSLESENIDHCGFQDKKVDDINVAKEVDDANVASTSTTPLKNSNDGNEKLTDLDDSGFMEQPLQSVNYVSKSLDFESEMAKIEKDI